MVYIHYRDIQQSLENDRDEVEGEGELLYNTDNEPFRRTLSDGDSLTVKSS
jgi:hypothetical protein